MQLLAPGVHWWSAPHPETDGTESFPTEVCSYALDDGQCLLVFDPVAPPPELWVLARARETAVILTNPWHDRDARGLVERLSTPVWLPEPDAGTGDCAWLLEQWPANAHRYASGSELPAGIQARRGHKHNDFVLHVPGHEVLVSGDTLVDFGSGLEISEEWLPADVTREAVAAGLRDLLQLPAQHVLAAHGGPHDRAALVAALS